MFEPGRVAALGVSVGDLVGSGSPPDGLERSRVDGAVTAEIGPNLADLLAQASGDPLELDACVWSLRSAGVRTPRPGSRSGLRGPGPSARRP